MMRQAPHSGANRARRQRGGGRVWWVGVAVAAGMFVIAIAGFWGYRTQVSTWPTPAPAAPAVLATASTEAGAMQAATGYVPKAGTKSGERRSSAMGSATAQPEALKWPMWEFLLRQPIPPRNPPLTPPAWRLIGASQSAGNWSIIVMRQGKTAPEYFKTGESLPGGYRIQSITEEDVTLVKGRLPVILSYIGSR